MTEKKEIKKSYRPLAVMSAMSLTEDIGWGQNFGRKRSSLIFAGGEREIRSEEELNCLTQNTKSIYVGQAASRQTYLENATNGCCGD